MKTIVIPKLKLLEAWNHLISVVTISHWFIKDDVINLWKTKLFDLCNCWIDVLLNCLVAVLKVKDVWSVQAENTWWWNVWSHCFVVMAWVFLKDAVKSYYATSTQEINELNLLTTIVKIYLDDTSNHNIYMLTFISNIKQYLFILIELLLTVIVKLFEIIFWNIFEIWY